MLLWPAAAWAQAPSDDELLHKAVATFQEGVAHRGQRGEVEWFRQVAADFAELRHRGFHSAALASNEGNACLLANDVPGAILAYRQGLNLSPNDIRLRSALAYARTQVLYQPHSNLGKLSAERWPVWLPRPTPMMAWVSLGCLYALACVTGTLWWMTRQRGPLLASGVCLLLSTALGAWLAWQRSAQADDLAHPVGVVADDHVYVLKGNGPLYEKRYDTPLNQGVEVRRRFLRHGWVQVELAGGQVGWLPEKAVKFDQP